MAIGNKRNHLTESTPTKEIKNTNVFDNQIKVETKEEKNTRIDIVKNIVALIGSVELSKLDKLTAQKQIKESAEQYFQIENINLSGLEKESLIADIIDDMTGFGPLESLLERNDIADIMVCGPNKIFIEVDGRLTLTNIRFRDVEQLVNVCRKIASSVGRRVDENSPICDARLADGSRVAIVIPPLALDGPSLTIRKFKKEKLSMETLVSYGSLSKEAGRLLEIASRCKCNILVSGGTGSGKTTLLNCLTRYIDSEESIITCEDAAELQLQQPNVRRWETRPPNVEGVGEVSMSALVKAALRHRPDRIIIGEVRGREAFDLLQAMNTGHDGSAGTVHSNSPRDAIARVESLVAQTGFNLPISAIREMIVSAIDIIVQAERLKDGSRKVTRITEVSGLEGDKPVLKDLVEFVSDGEENGKITGKHVINEFRPKFSEKAKYYGLEAEIIKLVSRGK